MSTGKFGRVEPFTITIRGETASAKNSRRLVKIFGNPAFIKSAKASKYCDDFRQQCPILDPLFLGDLHVDLDIWYASRRPDLDEALVLDLMQKRLYLNDRQVKSRRVRWGLDPCWPRTTISIRPALENDYAGT